MKKLNNKLISFRLSKQLQQRVKKFARENDTTQTEVIRHALKTLVDHE